MSASGDAGTSLGGGSVTDIYGSQYSNPSGSGYGDLQNTGVLGGSFGGSGGSGSLGGLGQYMQILGILGKLMGGQQGGQGGAQSPPPLQHIPSQLQVPGQVQPVTPTTSLAPQQQAALQRLLLGG